MNLLEQVEPLFKPRFRLPPSEACTPRSVAIHFEKSWLKRASEPSRTKQGTQTHDGSYHSMSGDEPDCPARLSRSFEVHFAASTGGKSREAVAGRHTIP